MVPDHSFLSGLVHIADVIMSDRIISAKRMDLQSPSYTTFLKDIKNEMDVGNFEVSNAALKMSAWFAPNGVIFNHADVAPPPSKDYCQVVVTTNNEVHLD